MVRKLSNEQFQQLHKLLKNAYRSTDDFTLFVALRLYENADNFSPNSGLDIRILSLMNRYEAQIEKLIDAALKDPKHHANLSLQKDLHCLLDNLDQQSVLPESISPFDVCFMPPGRPFINRNKFRDHLKDLQKDLGKRFLLVNGAPGSGKTYSQYLVEALASHFNFRTCFIELEHEIPAKYYPDIMARRIDRDLTLPETEPLPTQENVGDRWAQELCDWLVEKIRLDSDRVWIILDGFSILDLPTETKHFTRFLIEAVDKRLSQVRLILLDYNPESLRRALRPFVLTEDIQDIDQEGMETFFSTFFDYEGIEYDTEQLQDIVTRILKNIPSGQLRMEEIMIRVTETSKQLLTKE